MKKHVLNYYCNNKLIRKKYYLITKERPNIFEELECNFRKMIKGYTKVLNGTLRYYELINLKDIQAFQAKRFTL